MARRTIDISFILTILVGAFLVLDGISGLSQSNSFFGEVGRALGAQSSTINLIVAIVELVAGALLLLSLIVSLGELERFLGLAIFIAWAVIMVLVFVINNFAPDTLGWWLGVVEYSIILAVIWLVKGRRA
jgi:Ca2+/Na+ antiporter